MSEVTTYTISMSDSATTKQAPRIAIKFGAPAASKSANNTRKAGQFQTPSSLGKRPRSHALGHDSDSEGDDTGFGKHEKVTTIGTNDDEDDSRRADTKLAGTESKSLVIACQTEGVWKASARPQKKGQALPHEREQQNQIESQTRETEPADIDKQIKWGLTLTKKPAKSNPSDVERDQAISVNQTEDPTEGEGVSKTTDQQAIDALLGKDDGRKKNIVITGIDAPQDEFQAAIASAGEVSTIEEYAEIPDGEFGMAMLRGMGYKETKQSTKPKEIKRRSALLGLGAKEDEEIKKADLAKKYGHRDRAPRLDEYRRGEEAKRKQREERYSSSSYKHEREREKTSQGSSRRHDDRDRDRYRDRDRDRDSDKSRHHDRHSRR